MQNKLSNLLRTVPLRLRSKSNVQIDEITIENGNAMGKHVDITATEYYEKNDGAKVPTPRANVISLDDEVHSKKRCVNFCPNFNTPFGGFCNTP